MNKLGPGPPSNELMFLGFKQDDDMTNTAILEALREATGLLELRVGGDGWSVMCAFKSRPDGAYRPTFVTRSNDLTEALALLEVDT